MRVFSWLPTFRGITIWYIDKQIDYYIWLMLPQQIGSRDRRYNWVCSYRDITFILSLIHSIINNFIN